jgi:hypothetical protein
VTVRTLVLAGTAVLEVALAVFNHTHRLRPPAGRPPHPPPANSDQHTLDQRQDRGFWAVLQREVLDRQRFANLVEAEIALTRFAEYYNYHRLSPCWED